MKTLVIVAHPHLDDSPTQQFLKASAAKLPVTWHEVAPQPASPWFDVAGERRLLQAADRLVLQFPLYWYAAPARLKLWLDAVWPHRGLVGKQLGVVVSLGAPISDYQRGGRAGVSLSELVAPYAALARVSGMTLLPVFPVAQFGYQTEREHQHLLVTYQQYLTAASAHFADRATWWEAELAQREPGPLRAYLSAAVTEYTRLQESLTEMKAGEVDE